MNLKTTLSITVLLSGCAQVTVDYAAPKSEPTATLQVRHKDMDYQKNMVINYRESSLCDPKSAKLMGILNAKVLGYPDKDKLEFTVAVRANSEVGISSPQFHVKGVSYNSAIISTCEPLMVFTPKSGEAYVVEFEPCTGTVYRLNVTSRMIEPTSRQDRSCRVVSQPQISSNGNLSYLVPATDSQER